MQNIEIKYRITDSAGLIDFLEQQNDVRRDFHKHQKDIYLKADSGRLKIRIEDAQTATLIEYHRPDTATTRISNYSLTPFPNATTSVTEFCAGRSIVATVEKSRRLYLYRNVRIHVDQVTGLGDFMEFESVISDDCPADLARRNLDEIHTRLGPYLGEAQSLGYLELLLEKK